jgi:glutathione reductase (NADPH)
MPDLESLDLNAAEVETDEGRIRLNACLQSLSNAAVYAAGDAASKGPPLTPVAAHDANVAVANMLQGNEKEPNYSGVPRVVFSIPPLAAVGLTEEEARQQRFRLRVHAKKAPQLVYRASRRRAELRLQSADRRGYRADSGRTPDRTTRR